MIITIKKLKFRENVMIKYADQMNMLHHKSPTFMESLIN